MGTSQTRIGFWPTYERSDLRHTKAELQIGVTHREQMFSAAGVRDYFHLFCYTDGTLKTK